MSEAEEHNDEVSSIEDSLKIAGLFLLDHPEWESEIFQDENNEWRITFDCLKALVNWGADKGALIDHEKTAKYIKGLETEEEQT